MEREDHFYGDRGGTAAGESRRRSENYNRDGYNQEYGNRYGREEHRGNARDADRDYRQRDYAMERNYYENVGNSSHDLDNIRQGYGIPSFGSRSEQPDERARMERERRQEYNAGRMGGYSGAAFGGANYSSHGGFGGADRYGNMSGHGGNSGEFPSSSGYGGGYGESRSSERGGSYRSEPYGSFGSSRSDYERRRSGGRR